MTEQTNDKLPKIEASANPSSYLSYPKRCNYAEGYCKGFEKVSRGLEKVT